MTGSPSKRQRLASNTTIAEDPGIDEDVFVTPRPRMPQPRASKSETSSNRSQSPVKMQELASLHSGGSAYVDLDSLRDVTADHPLHELLALLKRVKSFSLGSGVVTEARKEELKRDADTWEVFENSQHSFDDTGSRENYGATPSLEEALRMRKESRVCRLRQEPEPAWNERVHYPLLRMALDKSPHRTSLEVANVTAARVQPYTLLPSWRSGEGLRSKLVDYAITLSPDALLSLAYANIDPLDGAPSRSFNSTCLNTILQEPIALSVETKKQGGDTDKALVQLFTWASAQVSRLVLLSKSSGHPLSRVALPLLSVQGSSWRMYAVTWSAGAPFVLWDLFDCGQTEDVLGFYKVIAILQLLMHWAQTEFRAWIHGIVPLTPEERESLAPVEGI